MASSAKGHEFEQTLGGCEGQGSWWAAVHDVEKSRTQLSNWTTTNSTPSFNQGEVGWLAPLSVLITGFTGTPRPLDSAQDLPVSSLLPERTFLLQRTLGWGWGGPQGGEGKGRWRSGDCQTGNGWRQQEKAWLLCQALRMKSSDPQALLPWTSQILRKEGF